MPNPQTFKCKTCRADVQIPPPPELVSCVTSGVYSAILQVICPKCFRVYSHTVEGEVKKVCKSSQNALN